VSELQAYAADLLEDENMAPAVEKLAQEMSPQMVSFDSIPHSQRVQEAAQAEAEAEAVPAFESGFEVDAKNMRSLVVAAVAEVVIAVEVEVEVTFE